MSIARSAPRVALYARYSSDNQRDASIEDQLRQCRERAAREGWTVVETYSDRAISGASLIRSGIQSVLADAQAGRFDMVLSEALDRISRDQEDVAGVFKRLSFAGVRIFTLSEGEINELHVGLKGTMNALFLKDLAIKTHRGIRGRVEAGKIGGGNAYGYRVVHQLDARGEPIRGEREIIEEQAEIVRRIFREYVAGKGPQRIAADLNRDGIASPTGKRWNDTTIRGNRIISSGILNCELYNGVIRWNRQKKLKNPDTGRFAYRLNPESEWIRAEAPELRIVPQALWDAAKARQDALTALYQKQIDGSRAATRILMAKNGGLNATHRPRTLLSGLVFCGCCGGTYARRGQDRFACSNHVLANGCDNARTIARDVLEARVLTGLRDHMMTPDMAAEAMRAYAQETNRLNRERRQSEDATRRELAETVKAIAEIVRVIEQGGYHRALSTRLTELETKQDGLTARLSDASQDTLDIHPNIAETYRRRIERLTAALDHPDDALEAADALREVIDRIVVTPGDSRGDYSITLQGELGTILDWIDRTGKPGYKPNPDLPNSRLSVSVKTRAGTAQLLALVALQAAILGTALVLWRRGEASAGDMAYVLTTYFVVHSYLRDIGMHVHNLQRALNEVEELVEIHHQPVAVADAPGAVPAHVEEGRIAFEAVTFRYGGHTTPLYENLSVSIDAGERVGLVGHSGSGKTTFVKLIQRLHDVSAGRVLVDGQDVRALTQASLRRAIAVVQQEPVLFHRSLMENIAYGRPDADFADIRRAAALANAAGFIERLPRGYGTLVGERGVKLSGGERQRIAIARAFLADAPILILDEATSSLDSESEAAIQEAMERLMVGRTTLVIAHRLSTVRALDRLLVFDKGRIVEEGDHDALVQREGGLYRRLFERQALDLSRGLAA